MNNAETRWRKVGELDGMPIYRSQDGELTIEQDFEVLVELQQKDLERWRAQQEPQKSEPLVGALSK